MRKCSTVPVRGPYGVQGVRRALQVPVAHKRTEALVHSITSAVRKITVNATYDANAVRLVIRTTRAHVNAREHGVQIEATSGELFDEPPCVVARNVKLNLASQIDGRVHLK